MTKKGTVSDYGIIPARAGSSMRDRVRNIRQRDHPRACGEQNKYVEGAYYWTGSSPRVRGAAQLCA